MRDLDELFAALAKSNFRKRFALSSKDRQYAQERGLTALLEHARKIVDQRLAPAIIENDGKQTPMRNHPVFVAQHATSTCCRGCLAKWHGIAKGHSLTQEECDHVIAAIERWLRVQGIDDSSGEKTLFG